MNFLLLNNENKPVASFDSGKMTVPDSHMILGWFERNFKVKVWPNNNIHRTSVVKAMSQEDFDYLTKRELL